MAIINKRRIVPRERGRNGRITNSSVYVGGSSSSSSSGSSGGGGDLTNYTQKTVDETIIGNWLFGGQPTFNSTLFTSQGGGGANVELYNLAGELTVDGNRVLTVTDTGSGSGLDADLLDGYHASAFPRKNEKATITDNWIFNELLTVNHAIKSNGIELQDSSGGIILKAPIDGAGRYGLKYGTATNVGDSDLMMLCNRAANGGVAIAANNSTSGSSGEIEIARFKISDTGDKYVGIGIKNPLYNLDVLGNQQLTGYIKGNGAFSLGFGGDNWQLTPNDNNQSHLTVDRLTVRDRMDIYELVINQIRATNGSLWVSDSVKCESILGSTITVNEDTNITFQANDIIKAQEFDGRDLRIYTARVVSVGTSSFSVADAVGVGWGGMSLVRVGNSTNTDRQGALYLTSSDSGAPYMSVIDGNTGITPSGHEKLRVGKLNGITSSVFGSLSGYGLWGEGINNTGIYLSADGELQIAGQITIKNPSDINTSSLNNDTSWTDDTAANAAQSTANNATTDAANAQGTANTAIADAATAQSTANTAKSTTDKLETLATITNNEFKVSADANNYVRMFLNSSSDWGIEGIIGGSDVFKLGDENKIGSWSIDNERLYSGTDIILDASNKLISVNNNAVQMFFNSSSDYGLKDGGDKFSLGSVNKIGGWGFDDEKLYTSTMELLEDGGKGKINIFQDVSETSYSSRIDFYKRDGGLDTLAGSITGGYAPSGHVGYGQTTVLMSQGNNFIGLFNNENAVIEVEEAVAINTNSGITLRGMLKGGALTKSDISTSSASPTIITDKYSSILNTATSSNRYLRFPDIGSSGWAEGATILIGSKSAQSDLYLVATSQAPLRVQGGDITSGNVLITSNSNHWSSWILIDGAWCKFNNYDSV